jgi:hypothetical protein
MATEHSLPKMSKLYLSLIVAAVLPATAHAGWKTYNGRTGWRASVPDNLREVPYREWAPEGDPGSPAQIHNTVFWSPDRKVTFTVYTHPRAPEMSLQESFQDDVSRRTKGNDRVNYSIIKDNWFVVSGTNSQGFEFYEKFFMFDDFYVSFDFVYPSSKKAIYDPMVAKIAHDFIPNLSGVWDH